MPSVIFIHGTGVREPEYSATFTHIKKELHKARPDVNVIPCSWGEKVGAEFHYDGASVPFFDTTLAIEEELSDDEALRYLWSFLYEDPFYELRSYFSSTNDNNTFPIPGQLSASEQMDESIRQLLTNSDIQVKIHAINAEQSFKDVIHKLLSSTVYQHVIDNTIDNAVIVPIIARAIVALLIFHLEEQGNWTTLGSDVHLRDALITAISTVLAPSTPMGLMETLQTLNVTRKYLIGLTTYGLSWFAERRRGRFTKKTIGMLGDIFLYQGRGDAIRQFIRHRILQVASKDENIVILAHSLGGIASVDLLVSETLPVKQLITVGSQSPLFYEINALHSLSYDGVLPNHFPPWLNIYDQRDFLSYIAAGVFNKRGQPLRVEDIAVDNGQPFPRSHSSYWTNASVWHGILERIP